MPIPVNDQFQNSSGKALDSRQGKVVSGRTVPFASVAEANSLIPSAYRYIGLTVLVSVGGVPKDYHYKATIANGGTWSIVAA